MENLAGNAWETTCAAAMVLVQEILLGFLALLSEEAQALCSSMIGIGLADSASARAQGWMRSSTLWLEFDMEEFQPDFERSEE